ncbi:SpoIIE family protein phosphatase [Streptomyces oryzae]|uniref:SpoIIE family protein phosphatase n=1 Tax=Streptomyces oryzae TaxID=1434886 RepID=A0ABS3XAN2_9ACTN|nr:SpoIIE family protein phosphatase [Streptomyces oryzae]MBO8192419.1 SpoIIE family protein phosphatase [Streptomyces oryzae]
MRTDDALATLGAGLWTWDNATGLVTLDARAARLIGVAVEPSDTHTDTHITLSGSAVRSRLHAVDYVGFQGIATLALAEDTTAEGLLRVVDTNGRVERTVRVVVRPVPAVPGTPSAPEAAAARGVAAPEYASALTGLLYEVPETEPGSAAPRREAEPAEPAGRAAPAAPSAPAAPAAPPARGATDEWDWRRNREAFLLDTGRALAEAYSTADVLRVASSLAMPGFSPEALAVFVVSGNQLTVYGASPGAPARPGHPYVPGGGYGPRGSGSRLRLADQDPAAEAVRTGRALYLRGPEEYAERFPVARPAETQPGHAAWAFLPLTVSGRTFGAWMAAFARPMAFTPDERAVLTTVARMLAQSLSRAMLNESERELSARLQRVMRPAHSPAVPGMDLAARYVPTDGGLQIGGDWYDVIPLPSGRTALVIGDVQGHDVRAASIMGQLRVAVRAYASEGHHPDAVLSRASRFLHGMSAGERVNAPPPTAPAVETPGLVTPGGAVGEDPDHPEPRFATCLYAEVDPETGILDVARAGHPDPAVQLPDGPLLVRATAGGLPLGIEADADYPVTRLVLEPGERLLMCTDGLIERGGHDLETGWARISAVVEGLTERAGTQAAGAPVWATGGGGPALEQLADALVQAVQDDRTAAAGITAGPLADRREDDIALLLLARTPAGAEAPEAGVPVAIRRTVLTVAQAQPDRIAAARHQLHDLLHDWSDPDQVDGAVLMLSEMLTNVLVHTDGDAVLVAEITSRREGERRTLRVNVSDSSDELPHRRSPGELASSGRGLMLLGMLADRWGVDPRGEGKCIWFEVHEQEPRESPAPTMEPSLAQWEPLDT